MTDNLYLIGVLSASLLSPLQNSTSLQKEFVSKQGPAEYCITTSIPQNSNKVHLQNLKKIKSFRDLKVSEYLPEIPNEFSISAAVNIYQLFQDNNFIPQKAAASVEGGVLFEFFHNDAYYAIEAHNSGIITLVKREKGKKGIVSKLSQEELISQLSKELISEYGDSQTGEGYPTTM